MSEILDILIAARSRIADEAHWCQGHAAEAEDGLVVWPHDARAVRWCASGAVEVEDQCGIFSSVLVRLVPYARAIVGEVTAFGDRVLYINDTLGHAAVLELFDTAIRGIKQQEETTL